MQGAKTTLNETRLYYIRLDDFLRSWAGIFSEEQPFYPDWVNVGKAPSKRFYHRQLGVFRMRMSQLNSTSQSCERLIADLLADRFPEGFSVQKESKAIHFPLLRTFSEHHRNDREQR